MATEICKFYKYGYCRYGPTCSYRHEATVCEDESCDIIKCMKRHPKKCRYWADFGRCKFGTFCSYKHTDNAHEEVRKSFTNLQNNFLQLTRN